MTLSWPLTLLRQGHLLSHVFVWGKCWWSQVLVYSIGVERGSEDDLSMLTFDHYRARSIFLPYTFVWGKYWKVTLSKLMYGWTLQNMIIIIIIIIRFLINVQVQGQQPHQWAPFQIAGLLHAWQLTPDLQICLSWGSMAESFHSLQSLSVSCFHVILGLPGPRFPSTCMSKAASTAPLEHSTCRYHRSFRMRSRSSMPSRTSSKTF